MMASIDSQLVAFAIIAGLLTVTPGADMMLVIRNVVDRGRRAGLLTTLGSSSGVFVHATFSAFGLSLILMRSAAAFEVVKMLGAGYLVWLGVQSLRQAFGSRHADVSGAIEAVMEPHNGEGRRSFIEGLVSNLLNPKAAVFYLALLPQFLSPGDWVLGKSLVMASIHCVENLVCLSIVSVLVGHLRSRLMKPRVRRLIQATSGTVMIAVGVRVAMERAR